MDCGTVVLVIELNRPGAEADIWRNISRHKFVLPDTSFVKYLFPDASNAMDSSSDVVETAIIILLILLRIYSPLYVAFSNKSISLLNKSTPWMVLNRRSER